MYVFKNFLGKHAPGPPKNLSCFSMSFKLVLLKKNTLEHNVEIMPSHPLKILAMPLSAVYQHFPNESKFRSKVVVKDSQDCDSIIPLHFCLLFANYYL